MSRAALMARALGPGLPLGVGSCDRGVGGGHQPAVPAFPVRQGPEKEKREIETRQGEKERTTSGGHCAGAHLFPFRTEKLSPAAAMILRETVGK